MDPSVAPPVDNSQGNSNYALEKLRDLVRSKSFSDEGKLPTERALSETLGVGRRAVRRALEVLETEGLIWRRQGSGTYAGQRPHDLDEHFGAIVAETDIMEIMEVRLRVEPQLAQLAAIRARPAHVRRMRDLVAKLGESTDADAHELWDGALHRQIAQSAGNRFFLHIFDVINRVRQDQAWQSVRERARKASGSIGPLNKQHSAIVDAIAARDPGTAAEAMRRHLLTLQENLIRATSFDREEKEMQFDDA